MTPPAFSEKPFTIMLSDAIAKHKAELIPFISVNLE